MKFNKGQIPWNKGIKWQRMSGSSHPNWKGIKRGRCSKCEKPLIKQQKRYCSIKCRNVGYVKTDNYAYITLHDWVRRNLGTPDTCTQCNKSGLTGRKIDWANKSGEYKRELDDWIRLCKKCHALYDARGGERKVVKINNQMKLKCKN